MTAYGIRQSKLISSLELVGLAFMKWIVHNLRLHLHIPTLAYGYNTIYLS